MTTTQRNVMLMKSPENPSLPCEEEKADLDFKEIARDIVETGREKIEKSLLENMWQTRRKPVIKKEDKEEGKYGESEHGDKEDKDKHGEKENKEEGKYGEDEHGDKEDRYPKDKHGEKENQEECKESKYGEDEHGDKEDKEEGKPNHSSYEYSFESYEHIPHIDLSE